MPVYIKKNIYLYLLLVILIASCKTTKIKNEAKILSDRQKLEITSNFIDGIHYEMLGYEKEAVNVYTDILKKDPNHAASCYHIARIFIRRGYYNEAQKFINVAIKNDPKNKWYQLLLVELNQNLNKFKENVPILKNLVELYPDDIDINFKLANAYILLTDYKNAKKQIDKMENQFGLMPELILKKHAIALVQKDKEQALNELKRLVAHFPDEPRYLLMLGDFYLSNRKINEAVEQYEKILQIDPSIYDAALSLTGCYIDLNMPEKAVEKLSRLFDDPNIDLDIKIQLLKSLYDLSIKDKRLNDASYSLIEKLIKNYPNSPQVFAIYGDFLYRDKRYAEAVEQWKIVLRYDQSKYTVWQYMFFALAELERYEELSREAERCIELFPEQATAYYFAGFGAYYNNEYERALHFLTEAEKLSKNLKELQIEVLTLLGETHRKLKNHQTSDEYFEKVLQLDPNNALVLNNYSYYLSLRKENLEKAKEMSAKSLKINPNSPHYLDTYGWILYEMGNYVEAEKYLKKAVELMPDNDVILLHYGDVMEKLGNKDKAIEFWQKAKEKGAKEEEIKKRLSK